MSASAKAVVVWNTRQQPVQGLLALLVDKASGASFAGETNGDGYYLWPALPDHVVSATISVWGAGYAPAFAEITLTPGVSQSIRFGDSTPNPQDIVLPPVASFKSGLVLPAPPTRDELCRVRCPFQGLTVQTKTHGSIPMFDPAMAWPDFDGDHDAWFDAKAAAGGTHVNLAVSSQYDEDPGRNVYAGMQGRDFTQDLDALRDLITETICAGVDRGLEHGFCILLAMAGDGMSINDNPQPGQYNDPVGWTYGYDWLMQNFGRIWSALRGDDGEGPDLTPWILPMPGYDGVVPGWQPWTCVNNYVRMVRAYIGPERSQAIELSAGYNSWSGEANDWATSDGQMFDVILSEFPYQMGPPALIPANLLDGRNWKPTPPLSPADRSPWDQVWQIVGALIPNFKRPADMPDNDYPQGIPFRLAGGTPRGPFYYIAWEFDTYGWVRGCPLSQVEAHRQALIDLGAVLVG